MAIHLISLIFSYFQWKSFYLDKLQGAEYTAVQTTRKHRSRLFNILFFFLFSVLNTLFFFSRANFTLVFLSKVWEVGKFSDVVTCILNLDSVIDRFYCVPLGHGKNEYGWSGFTLPNLYAFLPSTQVLTYLLHGAESFLRS